MKKIMLVLFTVALNLFFLSMVNAQNSGSSTWTGFYVGLNAGYGFGGNNGYTLNPAHSAWYPAVASGLLPDVSLKQKGFVGGVQAGIDYQISNILLIGLETDFQTTDLKDKNTRTRRPSAPVITTVSQDLKWLGSTRARFGVLPTERFLIYGTAGLAYGDVKRSASISAPSSNELYAGSSSKNQSGPIFGGGLEFALNKNVSLKGEYLNYNLGRKDVEIITVSGVPNVPANASFTTRGNIVRMGINYRF